MEKREGLIAFRKSLGLTQADMADKLGCVKLYINDLELCRRDASIPFWYNFQEVFGIEDSKMWSLIKIHKKG